MSRFTWLAIYAALLGPALSLVFGQQHYRNTGLRGLYVWHESRLRDRNRIGSRHAAEPVRLGQDAGSEQYDRMDGRAVPADGRQPHGKRCVRGSYELMSARQNEHNNPRNIKKKLRSGELYRLLRSLNGGTMLGCLETSLWAAPASRSRGPPMT